MKLDFQLNAEPRNDSGRGASRRLRRSGMVPAILYGGDQPPMSISLPHRDLMHKLEHEGFYSHILSVNVNGETYSAVLRDLQRHPYKPVLLHLDLLRVQADHEIRMHVPIHCTGEATAPGVKLKGGVVNHLLTEVEVSCLPRDLPEYLEIDISAMDLNDAIHLSEVKLPNGVTIPALHLGADHDQPVVSIHLPRAQKADEEIVPDAAVAPPEVKKAPGDK